MGPIEGQPPVQVVSNPLQWQVGYGATPTGDRVCALTLMQGALNAIVQLSPEDMDKLGRDLIDGASQARTGLIIPAGVNVAANGSKENAKGNVT